MTMARDLARALDPALVAADCGLVLDDWQAALLRSTAPRVLMNCARQTGKSTVSALISLATAVLQPGALVLLVSPSQRQSGELFRKVLRFLHALPGAPAITAESALRLELANGSRVVALPGDEKTIRGFSGAALVVLDEASRIEDELIAAVRPMLATSQGRLIALSTPFGKRGFFFEAWHGDPSWHRVRIAASDCPRINKEFLEEELRELGQQRFSEEYELQFLENAEAVFPTGIIDAAFTDDIKPLWE
jgi:Terminase large subunit, T4likevirus-type, N-terminal